ncbi:MAG: LamG-like jellyroll fold domain-containing protein [bacterium]|nr:LamG-like jellyroll fold domain-containing protein [bacterium]
MKAPAAIFGVLALLALAVALWGPEWGGRYLAGQKLGEAAAQRTPLPQAGGEVLVQSPAEPAKNLDQAWALSGQLDGGLELPAPAGDFTLSFWYAPTSLERPANHDLINLFWMGQAEGETLVSLWLDSATGRLHFSSYREVFWRPPGYHRLGRPVWVVLIRQGEGFRVYLDLEEVLPDGTRTKAAPAAERLILGRGFQPETAFEGLIGAPRLWQRALSAEEVAALAPTIQLTWSRWAHQLELNPRWYQRALWDAGFFLMLALGLAFSDSLMMGLAILSWHLRRMRRVDRIKLASFAVLVVGWYLF